MQSLVPCSDLPANVRLHFACLHGPPGKRPLLEQVPPLIVLLVARVRDNLPRAVRGPMQSIKERADQGPGFSGIHPPSLTGGETHMTPLTPLPHLLDHNPVLLLLVCEVLCDQPLLVEDRLVRDPEVSAPEPSDQRDAAIVKQG